MESTKTHEIDYEITLPENDDGFIENFENSSMVEKQDNDVEEIEGYDSDGLPESATLDEVEETIPEEYVESEISETTKETIRSYIGTDGNLDEFYFFVGTVDPVNVNYELSGSKHDIVEIEDTEEIDIASDDSRLQCTVTTILVVGGNRETSAC